MQIDLNGAPRSVAARTLEQVLGELGYGGMALATAVNGVFVPARARADTLLLAGDRVEVLAPMQGG